MRQLLKKTWLAGLLALALTLPACGAAPAPEPQQPAEQEPAQTAEQVSPAEETAEPEEAPPEGEEAQTLPEDGTYTTKEDVALYIHLYGHLPDNFLTKKEAEKLGWPRRQPFWKLRGLAAGGGGPHVYGVRHRYPGRGEAGRQAHRLLQRRLDLLHGGPLQIL